MSGVAIVRSLLAANASLIAVVPAARIKAGVLPIKTALPAISVTEVSSVPHNTVAMTETPTLHRERVQVSWLTADEPAGRGYPGTKTIAALVLAALPNQHGTVAGFAVDAILPDTEGPDLYDDVERVNQSSRDFMVKYRA